MDSLHITLDVSQIVYEGTGVGRYTYELARSLLLLNSPHKFTFFAGVWRKRGWLTQLSQTAPFNTASWRIVTLPPKVSRLVFNHTPVPVELFAGSSQIFHASDWTEPTSFAQKVTTVHDLVFKKYPETVDPLILLSQEARLNRIVNNNTHIIADSLSTQNDLVETYGISKQRINVVYPGVDMAFKPQSKKEVDRVKNKYNLPDRFILSVGTQEPRKNISRLVEASQAIKIPLVLVGRHGWGEKTQSLGYVPQSDLPALYAAAAVFAYPSLYEGFGFPVLESMAVGTPVVTSNVSSLPEISGKAAVLIDPLSIDSIANGLIHAISRASTLKEKGHKQASTFTWESCAQKTLEVYEKIYRH